ncbi:MAG: DUF177 domain-containing protein [Pseudomonadota bacterium]
MGEISSPIDKRINVDRLPHKGGSFEIELTGDELERLATFNQLLSIDNFRANIEVLRWKKYGFRIRGLIKAELVQQCTVTLEPVPQSLSTNFEALFVPAGSKLSRPVLSESDQELIIDPEGDDPPEEFEPPWLDLGGIVQEFFALAIDPWPRHPSADDAVQSASAASADHDDADEKENPFAALAELSKRIGD